MTKFDSNMERDINRCAVALEKILKLLNEHNQLQPILLGDIRNILQCIAEQEARTLKEKKPAPKPARRTKK
tara:strand:+ start:556 stop:768 length:213 start_codon:yes stop_codon:yes gene_type:complete